MFNHMDMKAPASTHRHSLFVQVAVSPCRWGGICVPYAEGDPGVMGATWNSWRTNSTAIVTLLKIQALIRVQTTAVVGGVEGQRFDFRCQYEDGQQNNPKFFCYGDSDRLSFRSLIRTQKHDEWDESGRFSLYDNTTGAFFIVRVDNLTAKDSGTYRCGVDVSFRPDFVTFIQLNVIRVNGSSVNPEADLVSKFHLSLLVTAVMCVAAMLFICLFTLCLLRAVKHRSPAPQHNAEASSDYETMVPGVTTEPELSCCSSVPDYDDILSLPPPPPSPPDCCSHSPLKHRESAVSLGLGEYHVPKHIDMYQHLDLSQLEDHVYHSLNGPLGVKKQINCCNN